MGCFSYLCKYCGEPILSNSERGQKCTIFLLKDGKIVEQMSGEYDSYGKCFKPNRRSSYKWKFDTWDNLIDLHFNENEGDGFAVIHESCNTNIKPTTISKDDPHQGWGYSEAYDWDYEYDPYPPMKFEE